MMSSAVLSVRRAGAEDVEQVVDLRLAFLREMQPNAVKLEPDAAGPIRRYVANKLPKGEFLVWLAEESGQVVGTSGLEFFHRVPTFKCTSELHAYVLNMYTVPEWRGRGVATMLLRHVIEYVKTTPAGRITLHASEMGRPIYERLGFVPCDSEMMLTL